MAYIFIFIFWGLLWVAIAYLMDFDWGFLDLFLVTVSTSLLSTAILLSFVSLQKNEMTRIVEMDKVTIIGDLYILENEENTRAFPMEEYPIEIGGNNFVTYSRDYIKGQFLPEVFGFATESYVKELSDKEFIAGAEVVLVGIDKEMIK